LPNVSNHLSVVLPPSIVVNSASTGRQASLPVFLVRSIVDPCHADEPEPERRDLIERTCKFCLVLDAADDLGWAIVRV
jgi:hypothetical protein